MKSDESMSSKAIKLFTNLKPKGKFIESTKEDPRLTNQDFDLDQHLKQLNRNAVSFLRLLPELESREPRYEHGLHPDHYSPEG